MAGVDAALVWPNGKAYFFMGDQYLRYDVEADTVDEGYPQSIASGWPGLFSNVDAAIVWPNGKAYFFSGDKYTRWDTETDTVDEGYPQPIADSWPGLFTSDIDAAIAWPNGKAYFFSGDQYTRWDTETDTVDEGYPQPIADSWPGLFTSDVDAAIVWPNGKAYFFSGDQYTRWDTETDTVDEGYPQSIASGWPGLTTTPKGGPKPAGGGGSVRDSFLAFSDPLEGRVHCMYLDIKGLVTTGIGNLIDRVADATALPWVHKETEAPATAAEVEAEWNLVKGRQDMKNKLFPAFEKITDLRLTDAAIDELVLAKFDAHEKVLRQAFPSWDTWPADAQLCAHSIIWAGAGFPTKWINFRAAAEAGDWAGAAAESHIKDDDNPGVRPRNKANLICLRNAEVVAAQGLPRDVVHYPTAL